MLTCMLLGPGLKLLHFGEPYQSKGEMQNEHHIQACILFANGIMNGNIFSPGSGVLPVERGNSINVSNIMRI